MSASTTHIDKAFEAWKKENATQPWLLNNPRLKDLGFNDFANFLSTEGKKAAHRPLALQFNVFLISDNFNKALENDVTQATKTLNEGASFNAFDSDRLTNFRRNFFGKSKAEEEFERTYHRANDNCIAASELLEKSERSQDYPNTNKFAALANLNRRIAEIPKPPGFFASIWSSISAPVVDFFKSAAKGIANFFRISAFDQVDPDPAKRKAAQARQQREFRREEAAKERSEDSAPRVEHTEDSRLGRLEQTGGGREAHDDTPLFTHRRQVDPKISARKDREEAEHGPRNEKPRRNDDDSPRGP